KVTSKVLVCPPSVELFSNRVSSWFWLRNHALLMPLMPLPITATLYFLSESNIFLTPCANLLYISYTQPIRTCTRYRMHNNIAHQRTWIVSFSQCIGLQLVKIWLKQGHRVLASARQAQQSSALTELKQQYGEQLQCLNVDVSDAQ